MMHRVSSKGAVPVMTKCVARELAAHNIRVNTIVADLTNSESVLENEAFGTFRGPTWSER